MDVENKADLIRKKVEELKSRNGQPPSYIKDYFDNQNDESHVLRFSYQTSYGKNQIIEVHVWEEKVDVLFFFDGHPEGQCDIGPFLGENQIDEAVSWIEKRLH